MIDPLDSLTFTMQANKGVYALLLGSGVSRSAGIPTGWEVTLDLVRKLSVLKNEECGADPASWYEKKYGAEPEYSQLLENLARTKDERRKLLESYFTATQEEREQGLKVPQKAHQAIAELAAGGYIRVVLTVNFDRLLEEAMIQEGLSPTVISTPDAAEGAVPLVHNQLVVVKLHGDYLDTRILNSPQELEKYDPRINKLLERIFDEYGLVVCGWSVEWDAALREALERNTNRRYTTYWACRGEPGETASKLISLRCAEMVQIDNADQFFSQLNEKVAALEMADRPHPLSTKIAVAMLTKYIQDDRHVIDAHNLVMDAARQVLEQISDQQFPTKGVSFNDDEELKDEINSRIVRYAALMRTLVALMVTGCYWGREEHQKCWADCLLILSESLAQQRGGDGRLLELALYPSLLVYFAGGLASVAGDKVKTFANLVQTKVTIYGDRGLAAEMLSVWRFQVAAKLIKGLETRRMPLSEHLFGVLREPLKKVIPSDSDYEETFDRFEYLLGLVVSDARQQKKRIPAAPIGKFALEYVFNDRDAKDICSLVQEEIVNKGNDWPLLQAGLFGGDLERLLESKAKFDDWMRKYAQGNFH
ncbi:SIR2 family protein [bacterium]|nr:SIR2 family protein [bacterium]